MSQKSTGSPQNDEFGPAVQSSELNGNRYYEEKEETKSPYSPKKHSKLVKTDKKHSKYHSSYGKTLSNSDNTIFSSNDDKTQPLQPAHIGNSYLDALLTKPIPAETVHVTEAINSDNDRKNNDQDEKSDMKSQREIEPTIKLDNFLEITTSHHSPNPLPLTHTPTTPYTSINITASLPSPRSSFPNIANTPKNVSKVQGEENNSTDQDDRHDTPLRIPPQTSTRFHSNLPPQSTSHHSFPFPTTTLPSPPYSLPSPPSDSISSPHTTTTNDSNITSMSNDSNITATLTHKRTPPPTPNLRPIENLNSPYCVETKQGKYCLIAVKPTDKESLELCKQLNIQKLFCIGFRERGPLSIQQIEAMEEEYIEYERQINMLHENTHKLETTSQDNYQPQQHSRTSSPFTAPVSPQINKYDQNLNISSPFGNPQSTIPILLPSPPPITADLPHTNLALTQPNLSTSSPDKNPSPPPSPVVASKLTLQALFYESASDHKVSIDTYNLAQLPRVTALDGIALRFLSLNSEGFVWHPSHVKQIQYELNCEAYELLHLYPSVNKAHTTSLWLLQKRFYHLIRRTQLIYGGIDLTPLMDHIQEISVNSDLLLVQLNELFGLLEEFQDQTYGQYMSYYHSSDKAMKRIDRILQSTVNKIYSIRSNIRIGDVYTNRKIGHLYDLVVDPNTKRIVAPQSFPPLPDVYEPDKYVRQESLFPILTQREIASHNFYDLKGNKINLNVLSELLTDYICVYSSCGHYYIREKRLYLPEEFEHEEEVIRQQQLQRKIEMENSFGSVNLFENQIEKDLANQFHQNDDKHDSYRPKLHQLLPSKQKSQKISDRLIPPLKAKSPTKSDDTRDEGENDGGGLERNGDKGSNIVNSPNNEPDEINETCDSSNRDQSVINSNNNNTTLRSNTGLGSDFNKSTVIPIHIKNKTYQNANGSYLDKAREDNSTLTSRTPITSPLNNQRRRHRGGRRGHNRNHQQGADYSENNNSNCGDGIVGDRANSGHNNAYDRNNDVDDVDDVDELTHNHHEDHNNDTKGKITGHKIEKKTNFKQSHNPLYIDPDAVFQIDNQEELDRGKRIVTAKSYQQSSLNIHSYKSRNRHKKTRTDSPADSNDKIATPFDFVQSNSNTMNKAHSTTKPTTDYFNNRTVFNSLSVLPNNPNSDPSSPQDTSQPIQPDSLIHPPTSQYHSIPQISLTPQLQSMGNPRGTSGYSHLGNGNVYGVSKAYHQSSHVMATPQLSPSRFKPLSGVDTTSYTSHSDTDFNLNSGDLNELDQELSGELCELDHFSLGKPSRDVSGHKTYHNGEYMGSTLQNKPPSMIGRSGADTLNNISSSEKIDQIANNDNGSNEGPILGSNPTRNSNNPNNSKLQQYPTPQFGTKSNHFNQLNTLHIPPPLLDIGPVMTPYESDNNTSNKNHQEYKIIHDAGKLGTIQTKRIRVGANDLSRPDLDDFDQGSGVDDDVHAIVPLVFAEALGASSGNSYSDSDSDSSSTMSTYSTNSSMIGSKKKRKGNKRGKNQSDEKPNNNDNNKNPTKNSGNNGNKSSPSLDAQPSRSSLYNSPIFSSMNNNNKGKNSPQVGSNNKKITDNNKTKQVQSATQSPIPKPKARFHSPSPSPNQIPTSTLQSSDGLSPNRSPNSSQNILQNVKTTNDEDNNSDIDDDEFLWRANTLLFTNDNLSTTPSYRGDIQTPLSTSSHAPLINSALSTNGGGFSPMFTGSRPGSGKLHNNQSNKNQSSPYINLNSPHRYTPEHLRASGIGQPGGPPIGFVPNYKQLYVSFVLKKHFEQLIVMDPDLICTSDHTNVNSEHSNVVNMNTIDETHLGHNEANSERGSIGEIGEIGEMIDRKKNKQHSSKSEEQNRDNNHHYNNHDNNNSNLSSHELDFEHDNIIA